MSLTRQPALAKEATADVAEIFRCTGDHARASLSFGAVAHWVSSSARKLVAAGIGAVSSIDLGAVTPAASDIVRDNSRADEGPFVAYDCYRVGSIGFSVAIAGLASTVKSWKVEKH
jgi:hypothetical protein